MNPNIVVKDDSGHHYIIPEELEDAFYDWCEKMENGCDVDVESYNKYAIGGSLKRLKIYKFEIT